MKMLLYIAVGGVLGTLLRYGLGGWVYERVPPTLPWGTVAVNALGCFLLGFTVQASQAVATSPHTRALVTIGFCGALTTFSTYIYETVALVQQGAWLRAGLYGFGSLAIGFATLVFGMLAAAFLFRTGG